MVKEAVFVNKEYEYICSHDMQANCYKISEMNISGSYGWEFICIERKGFLWLKKCFWFKRLKLMNYQIQQTCDSCGDTVNSIANITKHYCQSCHEKEYIKNAK